MKISVKTPAHKIVYPDIEGNLELPAAERFGVEIKKPSRFELAGKAIRTEIDGGDRETNVDSEGFFRAHIVRIINPPELEIDGVTRAMRAADMTRYDELAPIMNEVQTEINNLYEGENSSKN